jgi:hypothetical protein
LFSFSSKDDQTGRRSILSDASERLDLQFNSANIDSDLNESISSKSNQGDTTDNTNTDHSHQTTNIRSTAINPAMLPANTSRTSMSSNLGQSTGRALSGRLTSIMQRRRSPDMLLKKWIKDQKIKPSHPNEPLPLSVSSFF